MATRRNRGDVNEADRHAIDFRYVLNILGLDESAREYLETHRITSINRLLGTSRQGYEKIIDDTAPQKIQFSPGADHFRTADLAQIELLKVWCDQFTNQEGHAPCWGTDFNEEIWDAFVQGYAPRPLEANVAGAPEDIIACIQTVCHGFTIEPKELFPLLDHQKAEIFDRHKLEMYAFGATDTRDLRCNKHLQNLTTMQDSTQDIEGTSVNEFLQDFGLKMGGSVALVSALAPAAKAEMLHQ